LDRVFTESIAATTETAIMKAATQSLRILAVMTILTGAIYPLAVTLVARTIFPRQANGSVVVVNGKAVGSELLAQRFAQLNYFWPRPSACDNGTNYVTVPSGASNLGPTSSNLVTTVKSRAEHFRSANGLIAGTPVPAEMVFASGSGLDPHISPESARLQTARVAKARGVNEDQIKSLVEQFVEAPQFGFLGEPRVNVLLLNAALDAVRFKK
jgi:K+-transporting ATPase ATPase C chain